MATIDRVYVVPHLRDAICYFREDVKSDDIIKATRYPMCVTKKDGSKIYYITYSEYDRWKLGRTYRWGNEIYRSGFKVGDINDYN